MTDLPEITPNHEPCQKCGGLLDVTAFAPFEAAVCPHCHANTRVKREFGAYRLKRRHAIGGMSVIFVGWDTLLNREVAIKVLNEEFCNDENRILAFENEARLTAQVNHPNVVKVYAVGRAYGRFYLVMELLQGESFERLISKRGALPEAEVLEIAVQVAHGLQAAKRSGMIHRDVKPGNILLDHEGNAHLVDFGLALITQDGRAQAEEIWATPYYVPPEALERGIEDFRSDIYAFGATLYHALAGRPPFESTSTANTILHRAKQTIPRLTKIAPGIGPVTGETIDRMMAFKPEHRWKSYRDVIAALENARSHLVTGPVLSVPSGTRRTRRKWGRAKLISAGLLIAVAGMVLLKPSKNDPEPVPSHPGLTAPGEAVATFTPSGEGRDGDSRIGEAWKEARALVARKDYPGAEKHFVKLSGDASLPESSRAWALLEASVSASLDGRPADARRQARESFLILKSLARKDAVLTRFRDLTLKLHHAPFPVPDDFPEEPDDLVGAMGTFALALKLWEQAQWEAALLPFASVRNLMLGEEFAWFRRYQNLADEYLADGVQLRNLAELPVPQDEAQAEAQIARLGETLDKLRTLGRARYNLRARQAYLARLRKGFREGSDKTVDLSWSEMRERLAECGRHSQFGQIAGLLEDAPADAPPDALWAWSYLLGQTRGFLADLAARSDWSVETSDGRVLVPTEIAEDGLRLADGLLVPFADLDPASLIAAHSADNRENHVRAIAFSLLVGLTDLAEKEAEKLAADDPAFLEDWKRVLVGISL